MHRLPKSILRLLKYPPQLAYALGLGPLIGRVILLLTTTGRKSGLQRVTPLQYEEEGDVIYIAAGRGPKSDWYRNLLANPQVEVRVKARRFQATAKAITGLEQKVAFLELRFRNHPRMLKAITRANGLPPDYTQADLEAYAGRIAVVALHPAA